MGFSDLADTSCLERRGGVGGVTQSSSVNNHRSKCTLWDFKTTSNLHFAILHKDISFHFKAPPPKKKIKKKNFWMQNKANMVSVSQINMCSWVSPRGGFSFPDLCISSSFYQSWTQPDGAGGGTDNRWRSWHAICWDFFYMEVIIRRLKSAPLMLLGPTC